MEEDMQAIRISLAATLALGLASCAGKVSEGMNPGECTDGADNDGNGVFDCDDPGCAASPDCTDDGGTGGGTGGTGGDPGTSTGGNPGTGTGGNTGGGTAGTGGSGVTACCRRHRWTIAEPPFYNRQQQR